MVGTLSSRTILRLLPFAVEAQGENAPAMGDNLTLLLCRICLLSAVDLANERKDHERTLTKLATADLLLDDAYHGIYSTETVTGSFVEFLVQFAFRKTDDFTSSVNVLKIAGAKNYETNIFNSLRSELEQDASVVSNYQTNERFLNRAIWGRYPEIGTPVGSLTEAIDDHLFTFFDSDSKVWDFWRRWYNGFLFGNPISWQLQSEISRIPDQLWDDKDAPAKVAEAIREIEAQLGDGFERPDSVPELAQKTLLEHVHRLLAAPDMTALAAEGAADILDRAIAQYQKDAPANCLPVALEHLHAVPALFRQIARTVKGEGRAEARAEAMASQILALNEEIARLEDDLKVANSKTVNGLLSQSALKALGASFGGGLAGSVGVTAMHLFGFWPDDLTLENFRAFIGALENAEPLPDGPTLPPDFET